MVYRPFIPGILSFFGLFVLLILRPSITQAQEIEKIPIVKARETTLSFLADKRSAPEMLSRPSTEPPFRMKDHPLKTELDSVDTAANGRPNKLVAITLALFLGPFGVHRLYLGTSTKVPVIYALTIGGGMGILPLIDIFHLLFTKDISEYRKVPDVLMWMEGKGPEKDPEGTP